MNAKILVTLWDKLTKFAINISVLQTKIIKYSKTARPTQIYYIYTITNFQLTSSNLWPHIWYSCTCQLNSKYFFSTSWQCHATYAGEIPVTSEGGGGGTHSEIILYYNSVACTSIDFDFIATELFTLFVSIFLLLPTLFVYLFGFLLFSEISHWIDRLESLSQVFWGDTMHALPLSFSLSLSLSRWHLEETTNYFSPLTCSLFKCFLCDWLPDWLGDCLTDWQRDVWDEGTDELPDWLTDWAPVCVYNAWSDARPA